METPTILVTFIIMIKCVGNQIRQSHDVANRDFPLFSVSCPSLSHNVKHVTKMHYFFLLKLESN